MAIAPPPINTDLSARVLVIEDQPETISACLHYLRDEGWQIDEALNVTDALHALRTTPYAALLLDLRLPFKPGGAIQRDAGNELLRRLDNGECGLINIDTPCVVFTAQYSVADARVAQHSPRPTRILAKGEIDELLRGMREMQLGFLQRDAMTRDVRAILASDEIIDDIARGTLSRYLSEFHVDDWYHPRQHYLLERLLRSPFSDDLFRETLRAIDEYTLAFRWRRHGRLPHGRLCQAALIVALDDPLVQVGLTPGGLHSIGVRLEAPSGVPSTGVPILASVAIAVVSPQEFVTASPDWIRYVPVNELGASETVTFYLEVLDVAPSGHAVGIDISVYDGPRQACALSLS